MENPQNKWRFLAGKIIYKWAIYTMAMLSNQRVVAIDINDTTINNYKLLSENKKSFMDI